MREPGCLHVVVQHVGHEGNTGVMFCRYVSEREDFVSLRVQRERQNFVPLTTAKSYSKAVYGKNAKENRLASRIPETHGVQPSRNLGETKVLPLIAAFVTLLVALGMGFFDSFSLGVKQSNPSLDPNEVEFLMQEVNRSSITATKPKTGSSELVFTRHKVSRGETISRIAYKHGLSPATIVSINKLDSAEILEEGRSLMIPYIDGRRIQHLGSESIKGIATRFNTTIDRVQPIPGSEDHFIYGRTTDEVSSSSTIRERFLFPVSGKILTAYGESVDDLTGISYVSEGIGIAVKSGTPVNSSKEGRVILTGHHSSYGFYVIMAHERGWKSFYGHLSSIQVAIGDKLDAWELLGYSGASGTARGPQLLLVLILGGESVDPLDYLY